MTPIDPAILGKFEKTFGAIPSMFGQQAVDVWAGESRGFVFAYQLCAAEKQAEIDALTARIATLERENAQLLAEADAVESKLHDLEQQRQQDREDAERWRTHCNMIGLQRIPLTKRIDAARAKEPHHD